MREYIVYFESYFHPRIAFDNNDDFQMPLYTMLEKKYGIIVKRSSENIKAMLAGKEVLSENLLPEFQIIVEELFHTPQPLS